MACRKRKEADVIPFPVARGEPCGADPEDIRFRTLLGSEKWNRLPPTVQARFGKRILPGRTVTYIGDILECRMSRIGWLVAQLLRPLGAPLPLNASVWVPATVAVTEDQVGGQYWTRIYGRRTGFPQVIQSCKRFAGRTGLEEYLGYGIGIALRVDADDSAIHFISDHLFLELFGMRLRLPHWLSPGRLVISHVDCGHDDFAFVLSLRHRLFGTLITQAAMFRERAGPDCGDGA